MDLSLSFLGTGASVPSARRGASATVLSRGGEDLLFDCGEGTQRQLQRSLGLLHFGRIFITHFHGDHILGLPGLIKTYGLLDRERELEIFGPAGLKRLFASMEGLIGRPRFPLRLHELEPGDTVDLGSRPDERAVLRAFAIKHRVAGLGYCLEEDDRPGRFDPDEAARLGVSPGPDFRRLQLGEPVKTVDGEVRSEQVVGAARPGRTVVLSGDTAPCMATVEAAADADLLVHEATFGEEEADRAAKTGHTTAGQAGALAREARVRMLALVHISARYHVGGILKEARAEFENTVAPRDFDSIEVPYRDRAEPRLVRDGARRGPETEQPG